MAAGVEEQRIGDIPAVPTRLGRLRDALGRMSRFFGLHAFSSITRRIIVLNLAALLVLLSGILYLNQFRAGLIDARVESLLTQGEIIAGAIAASATVDTSDAIAIDPEKLLDLQAGEVEDDDPPRQAGGAKRQQPAQSVAQAQAGRGRLYQGAVLGNQLGAFAVCGHLAPGRQRGCVTPL
jgi:hypothetical protein